MNRRWKNDKRRTDRRLSCAYVWREIWLIKIPIFWPLRGGGETINIKKGPSSPITTRLQWFGIGIGILYWFLESAVDSFLFHGGDLSDWIFAPDPDTLFMRLTVISILITFGFYAQSLINKRKIAEEEVRKLNEGLEQRIIERTAELEIVLESAPDAVFVVDSNGQIIRINAQAEKIFGYDRTELIGKPVEILIPERYHGAHIQHRRDYYSSPHMRTMGIDLELYGLRKDGSEFPADISLSPIETGKGLNVIAIIRDITERKEAEKVLKESDQKFRALIEKSYDGVMLVDINGLIRYASPGVTRILGYTSSELVGRNAFDIMHPNDLQDTQNLFSHLIQNPTEVVTSQFRYRHKDGSWRRLEGTGTNLLAEPAVQAIVGNFNDITEQKQAERRLATQYAVTLVLAESVTLQEGTPKIIQAICKTTGWDMGAIWTIDHQANLLRCVEHWHLPSVEFTEFEEVTKRFTFALGIGMPGRVWAGGKPVWIVDVTQDANFPRAPYAARAGLHTAFGFPIMSGSEALGIIEFLSREVREADEDLLQMFAAIGSQIGQFIERRRAEELLKTKTEQLEAVTNAMTSFLESGDWKKASAMILISALGQTKSEYGFIGVVTEGPVLRALSIEGIIWDKTVGKELYEKAMHAFQEAGYLEFTNMDNLFGRVITSGKVVVSNDPGQDPRSGGHIPEGHPALRGFLGVPILRGGDVVGMIGIANRPGGYSGVEQSKIEILCQAASVLYDSYLRHEKELVLEAERKQAEEQIRHLAYYDLLTDLPNRLMFRDDIDRAITAARQEIMPFAILVINLNRFKEINNTLGYQNGDVILRQTGERLQGIFQESGLVSRLGGDEFGLLLGGKDAEGATQATGMIMQRLEEPFSLEGLSLDISAGIGISIFPGHGEDADTLIRRAYIAMHRTKATESGFCIYTPESDQFIPERLALMGDLRSAIELNQLFLLYQPKIDLKTGRTLGVEALVRWQHPKSGIIPPDKFISLAEESGLIKQLTFWVLREALRQSRSWSQAGIEVSVAVNLSIKNLRTPLLLDQIRGLLSTWGVDPRLLRFEITESLIMADPKLTIEILTQLTLMEIRFSIDDFGTGYSSLRYLQTLPVDEIKIDKSFVLNMMTDESSIKIVRSTIELAHSLGLKVVAEGVESREVFDKLTALGCDAAQGYFISRPIPHTELTAWLRKQGQKPGGDKS